MDALGKSAIDAAHMVDLARHPIAGPPCIRRSRTEPGEARFEIGDEIPGSSSPTWTRSRDGVSVHGTTSRGIGIRL